MGEVIYALEEGGRRIYVGATVMPVQRARRWVNGYHREGRTVEFVVLESDPPDGLRDAEKRWIAHGRSEGWPLENRTVGGDHPGYGYTHSAAAKARMSAAAKRRCATEAGRANIRNAAATGGSRMADPAVRAKISDGVRRKCQDPEWLSWRTAAIEAGKARQRAGG